MKNGLTELVFILDRSGSTGKLLSCLRSAEYDAQEADCKISKLLDPIKEHLGELE